MNHSAISGRARGVLPICEEIEPRLLLSFDYNILVADANAVEQGQTLRGMIEVTAYSGASFVNNNPSAYYKFDESSGGTAADSAVNNIYWANFTDTATLTGSPSRVAGKFGNALHFNGTSQYVQVSNGSDVSPDDEYNGNVGGVSAVAWVKSDNATWNSSDTIISKRNSFMLSPVAGSKTMRFYVYTGSSWSFASWTPSGTFDITQWHHYAGTYDHSTITLYVDGLKVATAAATGNVAQSTNPVYIGADKNGSTLNYFQGTIDDAAIYKCCVEPLVIAAEAGATQYLRYLPPAGSYGDISELQVWGRKTPDGPVVQLNVADANGVNSRLSANKGFLSNSANTVDKIEDGSFSTYYESADANAGWILRDVTPYTYDSLGQVTSNSYVIITQIKYAPRTGYGSRMTGGVFQSSLSPEFTHDVNTLYTIASNPSDGVLTTQDIAAGASAVTVLNMPGSGGDQTTTLTVTTSSPKITWDGFVYGTNTVSVRSMSARRTNNTYSYESTIRVAADAPLGAQWVTITGPDLGGGTHSVTINFTVNAMPAALPTPSFGSTPQLMNEADILAWEANMMKGATQFGHSTNPYDWYYDGTRVFYNIADYTGDSKWIGTDGVPGGAEGMELMFRDGYVIPSNGNLQAWNYFPTGMVEDYLHESSSADKALDVQAVQLMLDDGMGHIFGCSGGAGTSSGMRPTFYHLATGLAGLRLQAAGQSMTIQSGRVTEDVDLLLSIFNQIFVKKTIEAVDTLGHIMQPWWIGLASEVLIDYYEYTVAQGKPDTRIAPALKTAADWLMGQTAGINNAYTTSNAFGDANAFYQIIGYKGPDFTVDPRNQVTANQPDPMQDQLCYSTLDTNMLIAPIYSWLYKMYGETSGSQYRVWGDELFHWGTTYSAGMSYYTGKQFNQQMYWSSRYMQYRLDHPWSGDTAAPAITAAPATGSLSPTGTQISWQTDERIASTVQYGTTPTFDASWKTQTTKDYYGNILVKNHRVEITGLTYGTTYYYRIKSVDTSGNTSYSNYGSFVGGSAVAPTNLVQAFQSPYSDKLSWDDVVGETGYKIEYSSDGVNNWTQAATTAADVTSYTFTNLSSNTAYYWRVKSFNALGDSLPSNVINGTTPSEAATLADESFSYTGTLNGKNGGSGWADAWAAWSGASLQSGALSLPAPANNLISTGSKLVWGNDGGWAQRHTSTYFGQAGTSIWYSFAFTANTEASMIQFGDLWIGRSYGTLRVTVTNTDFLDSGSAVATGTSVFLVANVIYGATTDHIDLYRNPTPGGLSPEIGSRVASWDIQASHLAPSNFVQFYVGIPYPNPGSSFDELRIGTSYVSVAPSTLWPKVPTGLSATTASDSQVNLAWTDTAGNEGGFNVYYSTDNKFWTLKQAIATPNTQSCSITGLNAGTRYYFRVAAYNGNGESFCTNVANATTTSPVVPGDANGDGKVNFSDYLILEQSFNHVPGGPGSDADFDNNGIVNFSDYLILEQNFNTGVSMAALSTALDSDPQPPIEPAAMIALTDDPAQAANIDPAAPAAATLPGLIEDQPLPGPAIVPPTLPAVKSLPLPQQYLQSHWRHAAQRHRLTSELADPLAQWEKLWHTA